ncbi:hypothetical protein GW17_00056878 [Ensete ventricosum]|nr:hypothetical protein GW17_00056878 [Ensete ventricosum]
MCRPLATAPCELVVSSSPCSLAAGDCRTLRTPNCSRSATLERLPLQSGRGLAMASHLRMQITCRWLPLAHRQRLLSLPIAATNA